MKVFSTLLLLLWLGSLQINAQELIYNLDTAQFSIIKNPGDTILTANTKIQSYKNFRIQQDATSGYINMVAQFNPDIILRNADGNKTVELEGTPDGSGAVRIYNYDDVGTELGKIELLSNFNGTEDARIITDEIEIRGGSDLAELFDINGEAEKLKPGMLVSLDPNKQGALRLSPTSYDKNIAGVLSGANGVKPGILMGQQGTIAHGERLVTISGRTYVTCNTTGGPIQIGDLLTSSVISGQAMKAANKRRSRGAIVGKAMSNLERGEGYVLVLVNLQ